MHRFYPFPADLTIIRVSVCKWCICCCIHHPEVIYSHLCHFCIIFHSRVCRTLLTSTCLHAYYVMSLVQSYLYVQMKICTVYSISGWQVLVGLESVP